MNDFLKDRGTAVACRAAGTVLGLGAQVGAEKLSEAKLKSLAHQLQDLGMVGGSASSYLDLAAQINLPSLTEAFDKLNKVFLPDHLNPLAVGAGFMLAAASLFVDFKNGDWVGRWTEEMENNNQPRLAKIVAFGGRLFQLASAGAIALTPAIITKTMELQLNAAQLADSWEGWVALMGVAALTFTMAPAAADGFKAGVRAKRRGENQTQILFSAVKEFVEPGRPERL